MPLRPNSLFDKRPFKAQEISKLVNRVHAGLHGSEDKFLDGTDRLTLLYNRVHSDSEERQGHILPVQEGASRTCMGVTFDDAQCDRIHLSTCTSTTQQSCGWLRIYDATLRSEERRVGKECNSSRSTD